LLPRNDEVRFVVHSGVSGLSLNGATGEYSGSKVTDPQFGFLVNDQGNEQRLVVTVMKIVF
jgi:hypothetical protein